jgi:hypothetical protein
MKTFISLAAIMLLTAGAAQANVFGRCAPNKTTYLASDTGVSTTSTTYVDVSNGTVRFLQGGTGPSCVVVEFSAATAVMNNVLYVRALILDIGAGTPTEAIYGGDAFEDGNLHYGAHAMAFVFPNVAPGRHFVQMQMRTVNNQYGAEIQHHTIIVMHQ